MATWKRQKRGLSRREKARQSVRAKEGKWNGPSSPAWSRSVGERHGKGPGGTAGVPGGHRGLHRGRPSGLGLKTPDCHCCSTPASLATDIRSQSLPPALAWLDVLRQLPPFRCRLLPSVWEAGTLPPGFLVTVVCFSTLRCGFCTWSCTSLPDVLPWSTYPGFPAAAR